MAKRALGPASLVICQALESQLSDLALAARIRLGCSGGVDSLALAGALGWLIVRGRLDVADVDVMIIDHGLQLGSGEVASRALRNIVGLGLAGRVVRVHVDADAGLGPEAAAREARLAALRAAMPGEPVPDALLLAHTLDDQAESVLLGLARGSGPRSLAGMAIRSGNQPVILRPLLGVRRETTEAACAEWGLEPWRDPHNADPRFLRSRIRHEVFPVLARVLGPGVPEALARTAELARQDTEELDAQAAALLTRRPNSGAAGALDVGWLAELPPALQGRVLRGWLASWGVAELDHERTTAVLSLICNWRGQHGIDVPGGSRVLRRAGQLLLERPTSLDNPVTSGRTE